MTANTDTLPGLVPRFFQRLDPSTWSLSLSLPLSCCGYFLAATPVEMTPWALKVPTQMPHVSLRPLPSGDSQVPQTPQSLSPVPSRQALLVSDNKLLQSCSLKQHTDDLRVPVGQGTRGRASLAPLLTTLRWCQVLQAQLGKSPL